MLPARLCSCVAFPSEVGDGAFGPAFDPDVVADADLAGDRDEEPGKQIGERILQGQRRRQTADAQGSEHRRNLDPNASQGDQQADGEDDHAHDIAHQARHRHARVAPCDIDHEAHGDRRERPGDREDGQNLDAVCCEHRPTRVDRPVPQHEPQADEHAPERHTHPYLVQQGVVPALRRPCGRPLEAAEHESVERQSDQQEAADCDGRPDRPVEIRPASEGELHWLLVNQGKGRRQRAKGTG
jgi:hypothetical protein